MTSACGIDPDTEDSRPWARANGTQGSSSTCSLARPLCTPCFEEQCMNTAPRPSGRVRCFYTVPHRRKSSQPSYRRGLRWIRSCSPAVHVARVTDPTYMSSLWSVGHLCARARNPRTRPERPVAPWCWSATGFHSSHRCCNRRPTIFSYLPRTLHCKECQIAQACLRSCKARRRVLSVTLCRSP